MKNLTGKEWSCDTLKCLSSTDASKIHLACKGWWRDMWMLNQFKSWELPVFVFLQKKQNSVGWLQPLAWLEYFFFKIFFLCGPFLKSFFFLTFLQHCFCFMFWFISHEACGIPAPWPGTEPSPCALEGKSQPLVHQGSPWNTFTGLSDLAIHQAGCFL